MLTSQCLRIGDLEARILGGESGDEIVQRVFPVLDDLVDLHVGETLLVVIHGGAILATLGSIAPGRTGPLSDDNPYNLDSDLVGGAHFCLHHRAGTWRVVPPASRNSSVLPHRRIGVPSLTLFGSDLLCQRGEAPASRWGVGFGTAGTAVGQRIVDVSGMPAFAAIRCRSMVR